MIVEPCTSSGSIAASTTVVCAKPSLLACVTLNPAAAAAKITIYDNASTASGTVLCELVAPASSASTVFQIAVPVYAANGMTAVVTGVGATAEVYYYRET